MLPQTLCPTLYPEPCRGLQPSSMRWKHVGQEFRAHLGFTVDWDISLRALGCGTEEFVELQGSRVFGLSAMGLGPD